MKGCGAYLVLVVFLLIAAGVGVVRAEEWMMIYDRDLNGFKAKVVSVEEDSVKVVRQKDQREFVIPFDRLADTTVEELMEWQSKGEGAGEIKTSGGVGMPKLTRKELDLPEELPKKFYPMSLEEIGDGLEEILAREGQKGFERNQVDGLNLLNAYRFLSGVPPVVKLDRGKVAQATDAANACQGHGSLSHDLGRSTDLCNLHQGQSSIASSVRGYIQDNGANNREKRGHRMWCLNHPMEETGFGESENKGFFAMWAMDRGGKGAKKPWAYPGMGLYPLSFMHGNGWSLYLTETAPAVGDLEVEVYLMEERPEKPFGSNDEIPGEKLPVKFVYTFDNVINFEPTGKEFKEPGIYYVRMKGGGVREQYLVELIDW